MIMRPFQKLIVFLNFFGTGLFVPVLSLFLLAHGSDLPNLSLLIGIYSAVVILAEVPSGMFADLYGRRNAYFLSSAFMSSSFVLLYLAQGTKLLIPGMVLFGLGGAFLSGSLDSLIMEDSIRRNGDGALSQTASSNLLYQSAGIAAGALLGGALPNIRGYLLHVIARLLVLFAVALLAALFVKEATSSAKEHPSAIDQLRKVAAIVQGEGQLKLVLLCILGSSITLFAIETYWQPRFTELISEQQHYQLGVLSALGYAGSMLGSFLMGRLNLAGQRKRWHCYLLFIALFGLSLGILALQRVGIGFLLFYIMALTLLGGVNVPEQTLLNSIADGETRASLLSLASLFSKIAGIVSSALCTLLILPIGISGVWLVMGGLTLGVALLAGILLKLPQAVPEGVLAEDLKRAVAPKHLR